MKILCGISRLTWAGFAARLSRSWLPLVLVVAGCATQQQTLAGYSGSLIWQVEKEGYAHSFVLGTIHSADPRLFDLPLEVRRALADAGTVAVEVAKTDAGEAQLQRAMRQPEGQNLEEVLGTELFERAHAAVSRYGVDRKGLRRLTPLGLVSLLVYPREELARALVGEPVLDVWLQMEAEKQGKVVRGLESYEEQIALFANMSPADQSAFVCDLVANHPEADIQFRRMLEAYLSGDMIAIMTASLGQPAACDPAAAERFGERLLGDRNRIMVERMIPLMRESATLVAVGTLHLPGEEGILALLVDQGFTVTRLQ